MKVSATKQNIIETAASLFYSNGYNLTGINEIIAEAGIAKATLYNHFKSKEDICIAFLQYKNETFMQEIEGFCKSKKRGKGQVLAVFDFLSSFFQEDDFNGCWCLRTISEIPKDNKRIRSEIQKQKGDLLELINQLIGDNFSEMSNTQSLLLSKQIYLLYESAIAESYLHQEKWPIETAKLLAKKIL